MGIFDGNSFADKTTSLYWDGPWSLSIKKDPSRKIYKHAKIPRTQIKLRQKIHADGNKIERKWDAHSKQIIQKRYPTFRERQNPWSTDHFK